MSSLLPATQTVGGAARLRKWPSIGACNQSGQTLALLALMLPLLVALVLGAIEIGTRMLQRAEVEDALAAAARSSVQLLGYGSLGQSSITIRPDDTIMVGQRVFTTNLTNVRGLHESPEAVAESVRWTITNDGASADCPDGSGTDIAATGPTVCAAVVVQLNSFLGWQPWQTQIVVGATLDQSQ